MTGGFLAAALAIALYTTLDLHTLLWLIRGLMFGRGLCMGFAFVPMQAASYATIEPVAERAGIVDLLDATPGRSLDRCGDHGQHPRRAHVAQPGADSPTRFDRRAHRRAMGLRRRCPVWR